MKKGNRLNFHKITEDKNEIEGETKNRKCQEGEYRTYNGECNNLKNRKWGAACTPYQRILKPQYDDGKYIKIEIKRQL